MAITPVPSNAWSTVSEYLTSEPCDASTFNIRLQKLCDNDYRLKQDLEALQAEVRNVRNYVSTAQAEIEQLRKEVDQLKAQIP